LFSPLSNLDINVSVADTSPMRPCASLAPHMTVKHACLQAGIFSAFKICHQDTCIIPSSSSSSSLIPMPQNGTACADSDWGAGVPPELPASSTAPSPDSQNSSAAPVLDTGATLQAHISTDIDAVDPLTDIDAADPLAAADGELTRPPGTHARIEISKLANFSNADPSATAVNVCERDGRQRLSGPKGSVGKETLGQGRELEILVSPRGMGKTEDVKSEKEIVRDKTRKMGVFVLLMRLYRVMGLPQSMVILMGFISVQVFIYLWQFDIVHCRLWVDWSRPGCHLSI